MNKRGQKSNPLVLESPRRRDRPQRQATTMYEDVIKSQEKHNMSNHVLDRDGVSARQAVVHNVFNGGFST